MRGSPHHAARWLRLVLACLTVAGASVPAYAGPATGAAVAVWVERREPVKQRPAAEASVPLERAAAVPPRVHARAAFTSPLHEARTAAPPRRLFLMHRALLH
jgi:hypothetical protein